MNVRGMGVVLSVDIANRPEPALYGRLKLEPEKVDRLAEQLGAMLSELKGPLLVNDTAADPLFQWLAGDARVCDEGCPFRVRTAET